MELTKEILREHSRKQVSKVADYVGNSTARFKSLIGVFVKGPYRVTQRASWAVNVCVERHPRLVTPHLSTLLAMLGKPGVHDAVKRNILRLLQYAEVPKRHQGRLVARAFELLADRKEPVAVRVFAMSVLAKLAAAEPDLKQELKIIIEDQLPFSSPAFVSRAQKILKKI